MYRSILVFSSLLSLVACAGGEDDSSSTTTYYADVLPLLDQNCLRCHTAGGAGTGDFTDPETTAAFAELMLNRIDSGEMPPAAADPECRDYLGSDHLTMPQENRDVLAAWIDAGTPLGDPADAPELSSHTVELENADMEVYIPEYTPVFEDAANPANEYRCFVLEHGRAEDFYVTALHPIVDNGALVHHVVLSTVTPESAPVAPGQSFDCIDGSMGADGQMMAAWAPGMLPVEFPEGYGMKVSAGEYLAVQMHYYQSVPETMSDASGFAFRTATEVDKQMYMAPLGPHDFEIPAGDADYSHAEEVESPINLKIWGMFPHMHLLGTHFSSWQRTPEGDETCLMETAWDFSNQMTYMYDEPVDVSVGDFLGIECTWDNSADNPYQFADPPVDTYYGERTDEEMCYAFTLLSFN